MGSIVKSVSNAVGGAVGGLGKAMGGPIGDVLKGVGDFAKSPLGQMAITAGLGVLTGGSSLLAGSGGLSGLSSLFGSGGASNLLGSLASNFLGSSASGVSGSGLSSLLSMTEGQGSGGLLQTLQNLFNAQAKQPQSADGAAEGQLLNLQQLFAMRQAQQLNAA